MPDIYPISTSSSMPMGTEVQLPAQGSDDTLFGKLLSENEEPTLDSGATLSVSTDPMIPSEVPIVSQSPVVYSDPFPRIEYPGAGRLVPPPMIEELTPAGSFAIGPGLPDTLANSILNTSGGPVGHPIGEGLPDNPADGG